MWLIFSFLSMRKRGRKTFYPRINFCCQPLTRDSMYEPIFGIILNGTRSGYKNLYSQCLWSLSTLHALSKYTILEQLNVTSIFWAAFRFQSQRNFVTYFEVSPRGPDNPIKGVLTLSSLRYTKQHI